MNRLAISTAVAALALAVSAALPSRAEAAPANLDCKLEFNLTGWAAIYKHAEGNGMVICEGGIAEPVKITAKGAGLTAGKFHVDGGTGRFTDVHELRDVFGSYAQAEANAGVVKSGTAQVLTKGTVSLALAGSGEGIDIGISVGKFTIEQAKK